MDELLPSFRRNLVTPAIRSQSSSSVRMCVLTAMVEADARLRGKERVKVAQVNRRGMSRQLVRDGRGEKLAHAHVHQFSNQFDGIPVTSHANNGQPGHAIVDSGGQGLEARQIFDGNEYKVGPARG